MSFRLVIRTLCESISENKISSRQKFNLSNEIFPITREQIYVTEGAKTLTAVNFNEIFSCIIDHGLQQSNNDHGVLFEESTKCPVNGNWEILNEKRRLSKKSGDKI